MTRITFSVRVGVHDDVFYERHTSSWTGSPDIVKRKVSQVTFKAIMETIQT